MQTKLPYVLRASFRPHLLACTSLLLQYANNIDGFDIQVAECAKSRSLNIQRLHSIHTNGIGCFHKHSPGHGTAKGNWHCSSFRDGRLRDLGQGVRLPGYVQVLDHGGTKGFRVICKACMII